MEVKKQVKDLEIKDINVKRWIGLQTDKNIYSIIPLGYIFFHLLIININIGTAIPINKNQEEKIMPKKITTKEFIKKAKKIHKNKYDYSKVVYNGMYSKIIIICKKHGEFIQNSRDHVYNKAGCSICGNKNKGQYLKSNTKEFIKRAIEIHGNKYNYSKVVYKNTQSKIIIICKKHKEFLQTPFSHINVKNGCPKCGKLKNTLNKIGRYKYNTESFIKKCTEVHGYKYDYKLTKFISPYEKVIITCKKHGIFLQNPKAHIKGIGCSKCKTSKGENKILLFLEKNEIKYIFQKKFNDLFNKDINKKLHFDFYLPDYNLLIEYDGEQHFRPVYCAYNEFKSLSILDKIKYLDSIKNNYAKENDIKLLRIPYWNFKNIETILGDNLK